MTRPLGAVTNRAQDAILPHIPRKIAILGGGMAAMTAALRLTEQPDWRSRYEVTVYQLGWRLGGKGASGRGQHDRIEEHGLHIWLGFYENAFRLIQQVYEESPGSRRWDEAFERHSFICVAENVHDTWKIWPVDFPTNSLVPGSGGDYSVGEYITKLLAWLCDTFRQSAFARTRIPAQIKLLEIAHNLALREDNALLAILQRFINRLWRRVEWLIESDDEARRLFILMDLGCAVVRGLIEDNVLYHPDGLDSLEDDFQDWLRKHGARDLSCRSAVIRGLYDLVFAYESGRTDRPSFAAGPALRSIFRMTLCYKGAIFWKMQAGMGDVVFAPIYSVLKNRGVKFEFLHKVENLKLSEDGQSIAAIEIGRQVRLKDPSREYQPLIDCKGLPCWPAKPLFDQIENASELISRDINLESFSTPWKNVETRTLVAGNDFDDVILGIPVGSLPYLCAELIAASESWKRMVERVGTVRTMALQLWLSKSLPELGWMLPSPVLDAYVQPLNTWADMSHLVVHESWPSEQPRTIAYFCGPMDDAISDADENVRQEAVRFIKNDLSFLWPRAVASDGSGFDWSLLVDPSGASGEARLDSQYWRANVDPSERYVLSLAHSTSSRLKPNESGFQNLFLAGDWTNNGFNAGCVEAAVMSGLQAANAVLGFPANHDVLGVDVRANQRSLAVQNRVNDDTYCQSL